MASPSISIYSTPKKFGCNILSCRNPVIYEFLTSDTSINIVVEIDSVEYANQVLYPDGSGIVKIDVSKFMRAHLEKKNNFAFSTDAEDTERFDTCSLKYKDSDEVSYTTETIYFNYGQHPISYKNVASCNDYMPNLARELGNLEIDNPYYEDTIDFNTGFSLLDVTNNEIQCSSEAGGAMCYTASFIVPATTSKLRITITAISSSSDNVRVGIYDDDTVTLITQSAVLSATGYYEYELGSLPVDRSIIMKLEVSGSTNASLTWDVSDVTTYEYSGALNKNNIKIRFKESYDFLYSGTSYFYYYYPATLDVITKVFKVIIEEIDEYGDINYQEVTSFSGNSGLVAFTKTAQTWLRIYAIYDDEVNDIGIINDNPFLTDFGKLKYYEGMPMDLSVCDFINSSINPDLELIIEGTGTDTITLNDSITRINLKDYIDENKTIYFQTNIGGASEYKMSKELPVTYHDCLPSNYKYLCWINTRGCYDYFLFNCRTFTDYAKDNEYVGFEERWGLNETMFEEMPASKGKIISLGTESLDVNEMPAMVGLINSPYVWLLTNPDKWMYEGCQWLQVKINKNSWNYHEQGGFGNLEFDIIIDKEYFV